MFVGVVPQKPVSHQIPSTRLSEIQISRYAVMNLEGLVSFLNQSTSCCRMSSWHDDITGYHNEETDDLHIGENDLKDLAMDR